ncbi:MAG: threonine synthase [bacterium]
MAERILYVSTSGQAPVAEFREVLFRGQPPDGGLYLPARIPRLNADEIEALKGRPYAEVALAVLSRFLEGEIPPQELERITFEAYDFEVPVERVRDRRYVVRLDRGPTASFKDFAARFMARTMRYYQGQEDAERIILVATSGDTGSAIASAFLGLEGFRVVVTYPVHEVSDRQARQMNTLGGNVVAVASDAKFDELQANAMRAFEDPDLAGLKLTSANSINWCRLMPQIAYHFYAYTAVESGKGEPVLDAVSSGNFGNVTADFLTRRMGKPVRRILVATNENDEFPAFLESGLYRPIRPSRACMSNAMNVGNPSNMRRLFALYGGRIDRKGVVDRMPDLEGMRRDCVGISISDHLTRLTIQQVYETYGILLEPHGAVSWAALSRYLSLREEECLSIATETAHPAKFPEPLREIGVEPELPPSMTELDRKTPGFVRLSGSYDEFKDFLLGLRS